MVWKHSVEKEKESQTNYERCIGQNLNKDFETKRFNGDTS